MLALKSIRKAQKRYKAQYDKGATPSEVKVGDWVFVHFPQEEMGKMRKLSRPWHGPYRVCPKQGADVTVTRLYILPGTAHSSAPEESYALSTPLTCRILLSWPKAQVLRPST